MTAGPQEQQQLMYLQHILAAQQQQQLLAIQKYQVVYKVSWQSLILLSQQIQQHQSLLASYPYLQQGLIQGTTTYVCYITILTGHLVQPPHLASLQLTNHQTNRSEPIGAPPVIPGLPVQVLQVNLIVSWALEKQS